MERVYDELKIMEIVTKMNNFIQLSSHSFHSLFLSTFSYLFFFENVPYSLAFHVLTMYRCVREFCLYVLYGC